MVDEGLTEGMAAWVAGHVLRRHLGLDRLAAEQDGVWRAGSGAPLPRTQAIDVRISTDFDEIVVPTTFKSSTLSQL